MVKFKAGFFKFVVLKIRDFPCPLIVVLSAVIAGKVFVVKTHDGKYAKFEILSYYKDAPATPDATSVGRYYTFNYAYQANSTTTF